MKIINYTIKTQCLLIVNIENAMTFAVCIIELIIGKIVILELLKHLFGLLLYLLIPNRGVITHQVQKLSGLNNKNVIFVLQKDVCKDLYPTSNHMCQKSNDNYVDIIYCDRVHYLCSMICIFWKIMHCTCTYNCKHHYNNTTVGNGMSNVARCETILFDKL